MPRPTETKDPIIIQPHNKGDWKYISPGELATTGIYTEQDLNDLTDRIMFPVERPSILNDMAREMRGHSIADQDCSILKLLNEETVMKIAESAWAETWSRFMTFGIISARVIGILLIVHVLKSFLDIIVRGYTLHAVFGWSYHLLGALWSSVAHWLLYSAQRDPIPSPTYSRTHHSDHPPDEPIELQQVLVPTEQSKTAPTGYTIIPKSSS